MTSVAQPATNVSRTIAPNPGARARVVEGYGKLPLSFEANRGQTDGRVKFLSRGRGYTPYLRGNEAVLALTQPSIAPRFIGAAFPGFFSRRTSELQDKCALHAPGGMAASEAAPQTTRFGSVGKANLGGPNPAFEEER